MKCDKLNEKIQITNDNRMVYLKSEVDAAIAELKAKLEEKDEEIDKQKWRGDEWAKACNQKDKEIESLKATAYADSVDAGMRERMLKRALWLTRAERADDRARIFYFSDLESVLDIDGFSYDSKKKKGCKKLTARLWRIIWLEVERKCRAKAEEYK